MERLHVDSASQLDLFAAFGEAVGHMLDATSGSFRVSSASR